MKKIRTHYDNLKVSRDAPEEVIRAAYRSLSQKYHPDRNPGNAEAERIMLILNKAYGVLTDPKKRKQHDIWIAEQEQSEVIKQGQSKCAEDFERKNEKRIWNNWINSEASMQELLSREYEILDSFWSIAFSYIRSYDDSVDISDGWQLSRINDAWIISAIKNIKTNFFQCMAEYDKRFVMLRDCGRLPSRETVKKMLARIHLEDKCDTHKLLNFILRYKMRGQQEPGVNYNYAKSIAEKNYIFNQDAFEKQLYLLLGLDPKNSRRSQRYSQLMDFSSDAEEKNSVIRGIQSFFSGSQHKSDATTDQWLDLGASNLGRAIRLEIEKENISVGVPNL